MSYTYDSLQPLSDLNNDSYFLKSSDYLHSLTKHIPDPTSSPSQPQDKTITTSAAIIEFYGLLEKYRVPGPLPLFAETSETSMVLLGQGGQFTVFKGGYRERSGGDTPEGGVVVMSVAMKRPHFSLYLNRMLDLSDTALQRCVKNMAHEILALRHRGLVGDPNIVQLIGWGEFRINGCQAPCLVLPLARCDLKTYLDEHAELPYLERLDICTRVGRGLDSLHKCSIIHGDLKFENILVFEEDGKYVPRISDFGFAVSAESTKVAPAAGTTGWQAPEVVKYGDFGTLIPANELHKADNYSYGLLVSRTMAYRGFVCPPPIIEMVAKVTAVLTSEDPRDRPSLVGNLLSSGNIEM